MSCTISTVRIFPFEHYLDGGVALKKRCTQSDQSHISAISSVKSIQIMPADTVFIQIIITRYRCLELSITLLTYFASVLKCMNMQKNGLAD